MEFGVRAIRTKYDGDGLLADDVETREERILTTISYNDQLRGALMVRKEERAREYLDGSDFVVHSERSRYKITLMFVASTSHHILKSTKNIDIRIDR